MSDTSGTSHFSALLTDLTGKIRLEGEDPRWSALFSITLPLRQLLDEPYNVELGKETLLSHFSQRLIVHNPITGNLLQLFEHATTRLRQLRSLIHAASRQVHAAPVPPHGSDQVKDFSGGTEAFSRNAHAAAAHCNVALHLATLLLHELLSQLSAEQVVLHSHVMTDSCSVAGLLSVLLPALLVSSRCGSSCSCLPPGIQPTRTKIMQAATALLS